MKKYLWVILLLINSHADAALMHGIFDGRFGGSSRFDRIPDGDPFQIRFEVEINPGNNLAFTNVILLTGGLRGDIAATLALVDYGNAEGEFQVFSNLSGAGNIFDSQADASIEFSFLSLAGIFQSASGFTRPFTLGDVEQITGSFYGGNLNEQLVFTEGFYTTGALPAIPLPGAIYLFGSAITVIFSAYFNKKRQHRQSVAGVISNLS